MKVFLDDERVTPQGWFRTYNPDDTNVSDEDLAWVRPGREKSGTAKNILRRKKS